MRTTVDFYGRTLSAFKANLHTHSVKSDGRFEAAELIRMYREAGYDVLSFSDHRTPNRVSEYDSGGMTLLSGAEIHPMGPRGIVWHFLAVGVPEDFPGGTEEADPQGEIDRINAAGGVCFVAHPYWCGLTSGEVLSLNGYAGIEVGNSACRYIGREFSMQTWDEMLDLGRPVTAIAVDDLHGEGELGRNWTMILADEATPEALLAALRKGDFYASQGPAITRLSFENNRFKAAFSPCCDAVMLGNRYLGCSRLESPEEFTEVDFEVPSLPSGTYLRLQIRDRAGRYAWSNPVWVP